MESLDSFFKRYQSLSSGDNPEALAGMYTDHFMAATPKGHMHYPNDEKFVEWLKQVRQFNEETGLNTMEVVGIRSSVLGDFYTSATVTWSAVYEKGPGPIEFDITYILNHIEDEYRIVMFISHEDQEEVMREKGLL